MANKGRCACDFPYCELTEEHDNFLYRLKDGSVTSRRDKWLNEQPVPVPVDYNAMDAEVQASGFIRKPAANEFYIVFDYPLTELERLQIAAAVFSALKVAFPTSHIGDYKGMI